MGPNRHRRVRQRDDERITPMTMFLAAVTARHRGDDELVDLIVANLSEMPEHQIAPQIQERLENRISHLWTVGWQPAVLRRTIERSADGPVVELGDTVLVAESRSYERLGRDVAPDWIRQLDDIATAAWWSSDSPYLLQRLQPWTTTVRDAVDLMAVLHRVGELPVLTPPPAEWHVGMTASPGPSTAPSELLDKVRALLAKAESTTFDSEAEAFTAKAQELMTRHRIDRALLSGDADGRSGVTGRHVFVDNPYPEAKAALLDIVASANGGHSIYSKAPGFSTVFAGSEDLPVIEHLFTSLLVQATSAMHRQGSKHDGHGRSRTTSFRRSFLVAFALRIGERLRDAADSVVTEAEASTSTSLVPILARQTEAARAAAAEAFPNVGTYSPAASDHEGWRAGTLFGDQADLAVGATVERRGQGASTRARRSG